MIWEVIRIVVRNFKKLVCPFVRRLGDEWYCKKSIYYHECDGYCPKKIRGDNNG